MTIAEMTPQELKELVRQAVREALREPLPDDEGDLLPEFEEELRNPPATSHAPYTPSDVRRTLGLPTQ